MEGSLAGLLAVFEEIYRVNTVAPVAYRWCQCNSAECHPSCAVTSYAKPRDVEPPFCLHCGRWLLPGRSVHKNNQAGLGRSWYIPSEDGHG